MGDRYRDELALSRANHKGRKKVQREVAVSPAEQERESLRADYFKAKSKGFQKAPAWRRLDGF